MDRLRLIMILLLAAGGASAQDKARSAEPDFTRPGVEAVKLPLPNYPKAARTRGLGGRVSVMVSVDASGKVTAAEDTDGPYPVCKAVTDPIVIELREAALAAAKRSEFKVTDTAYGRIYYEFGAPPRPASEAVPARVDSTGEGSQVKEMRLDRLTMLGTTDKAGARVVGTAGGDGKVVSGGVLNGKSLALPRPPYPPAARAVKAGGPVNVQVLIDESGNVYSAQAVAGHPLLRNVAEKAACGSRFTPTLLESEPVKVSGIITYNFVP